MSARANDADRESVRVMREELRRILSWLAGANTLSPDYAPLCERAQDLRTRLGLPEAE